MFMFQGQIMTLKVGNTFCYIILLFLFIKFYQRSYSPYHQQLKYNQQTSFMVKLSGTQKILLFEGIATMLLAFGVSNCNDSENIKLGDTFVAICLLAGIIISAPFTGGHVNPAVTLGVFTQRKSTLVFSEVLKYWVGQVLGAITGGILSWFCTGQVSGPVQIYSTQSVFFHKIASEAVGTFIFVCTILIVTNENTDFTPNQFLKMFTIAVALFFSRHFAISTGCLNPAVAVGLQFIIGVMHGDWAPLMNSWVFIFGPLIGAVLGAVYYDHIYSRSYPRKSIA